MFDLRGTAQWICCVGVTVILVCLRTLVLCTVEDKIPDTVISYWIQFFDNMNNCVLNGQ